MKISVKAGRSNYNKQAKKVSASKEKGLLTVYRVDEQTHISWVNTQTKIQQFNIIVFPNDAKISEIRQNLNSYILQFQTYNDKYYFWFQEKVNAKEVLSKMNQIINYMPQQMEVERKEQQTISNIIPPIQPKPKLDFIDKMQKNLEMHKKQHKFQSVMHLSTVLNHNSLSDILSNLNQQDRDSLIKFLPQEQQSIETLGRNVRSPQFMQAVDVLTEALNSQNSISLFMQIGLNQQFLKKYYGVDAFLKALEDWGNNQKKAAAKGEMQVEQKELKEQKQQKEKQMMEEDKQNNKERNDSDMKKKDPRK